MDLFDGNNNHVPPQSSYVYRFYKDDCDGSGWDFQILHWGINYEDWDGMKVREPPTLTCHPEYLHQTYEVYVTVQVGSYIITTSAVTLPQEGEDPIVINKEVILIQRRESGQSYGLVGRLIGTAFYHYPSGFVIAFPPNSTQIIKANQDLTPSPVEKFNNWVGYPDVINYTSFDIVQSTNNITSQFKQSFPVTIEAKLLEGEGGHADSVRFADCFFRLHFPHFSV